MGSWTEFFAAELSAVAALVGLIIVGISINMARILSHPRLPGRAAETLVIPTGILVVCSFALVPGQPLPLLGAEIVVTGLAMWAIPVVIQFRAARLLDVEGALFPRVVLTHASTLPFVVAGVLLLLGYNGALYWIVPGVIVSLVATVLNAWVLLVEILR